MRVGDAQGGTARGRQACSPSRCGRRGRGRSSGFVYLAVLFAIAILGIGLAASSEVWSKLAFSQKRQEFLWVAEQYRTAIGSYYESSPGAAKTFPRQLEDLVEDRRSTTLRRHLRAIYRNPFTGGGDWEPIRGADGGIRGVRAQINNDGGLMVEDFVYVATGP